MSKIFKKREYLYAWLMFTLFFLGGNILLFAILLGMSFGLTIATNNIGNVEASRQIGYHIGRSFATYGLFLQPVISFVAFTVVVRTMIVRKVEERVKKLTTEHQSEGSNRQGVEK